MAKKWLAAAVLCLAAAGGCMFISETQTETYAADASVVTNAVMGYAPDIGRREKIDSALYYLGLSWRELEPEEGVFDWEAIDEKYGLDALREKGAHLVLRFICDTPRGEEHMDIPDWLYEQTGDGSWYDISYGKGYSPDYSNAIFRAAHARAIAALGEHFGQGNFACYVELGSLGHWGEWHVKAGEGLVPMPGESIRDEYVEAYIAAFPDAKLLMRRPFNIAAEKGLGVYNDMTGAPKDTEEWLGWLANGGWYSEEENALTAVPDFWLTAPVGGEFTSSISMEEMMGEELERTLALLDASHVTFLGPKVPKADENAEGYAAVLEHIGYRLRIGSAELKRGLWGSTLTLEWTNDGAAPFYWDWDVYVYVEDAEGSVIETKRAPIALSSLYPGEEAAARVKLDTLKYKLSSRDTEALRITVGIIDPMTGRDAVRLAMHAETTDGGKTVLMYVK